MIKRLIFWFFGLMVLGGLFACSGAELQKEQAQLHLRIGTGFLNQGRNPQALTELLTAEKMDPTEPVIQNNLGLAYYLRKEYRLSESHFKKALEVYPKYSDVRNNLGRLYTDLGKYDDAIAQLNIVAKDLTYPNPERVFLNLGLAYFKKGDLNFSKSSFKKSMEANIKFCPAYNYYGQALFKEQQYDKAVEAFEQALSNCDNNYDEAHYYSALSFYKMGQTGKAVARLEEVERLYPNSDYSKKAKSMLKIIR